MVDKESAREILKLPNVVRYINNGDYASIFSITGPLNGFDVEVKRNFASTLYAALGNKVLQGFEIIPAALFSDINEMTELVIPEGVKTIGACAFMLCYNLKNVSLPSTLESIDTRAFFFDKKLKSVEIPASVKTIDYKAFSGCDSLKEVVIKGEPKIDIDAFFDSNKSLVIYANTNSKKKLYLKNLFRLQGAGYKIVPIEQYGK